MGWGNGTHVCDSTGLEVRLTAPSGKTLDAAKQFDARTEPARPVELWLSQARAIARERHLPRATIGRASPARRGRGCLNLGNPQAREWLTDHIDKLLTEQGIDLYRQDFNMDPLGVLAGQRRAGPAGHHRESST